MDLKEKIITVAYELFAEKGYESTTVSDIIKVVGSSRGGFYHHFKSKEEILEAITMNYIDDLMNYYKEILQESGGSIIDSLNSVFIKINQYKAEQSGDWPKIQKVFSFSGSHAMIRKLAEQFELVTTELYTKLILKGIEEGEFHVSYPKMLAGLWTREIIRIYKIARELIYSDDPVKLKEFESLLEFNENLLNNTLGFENNRILLKKEALNYVHKSRKQLAKIRREYDD